MVEARGRTGMVIILGCHLAPSKQDDEVKMNQSSNLSSKSFKKEIRDGKNCLNHSHHWVVLSVIQVLFPIFS